MGRPKKVGGVVKKTTSIKVPPADMADVSRIAGGLGIVAVTGGVQGRPGSISGFLEMLARAYRADTTTTLDLLRQVQALADAPKPKQARAAEEGGDG